jgi:hypothetical protein
MQRKECSCARIELGKRRVSSRMASTDKINHGLEIRREKSLGLFIRSSLFGTLMRAGFCIAAIPTSASAQTPEQIAAMQAQIAAREAQKNADLALQAQLDAISQRDALQAQLEDTTLAASQHDSAPSTVSATQDLTLPSAAPSPSPSPAGTPVETTPVPERGDKATSRAAGQSAPPSNQLPAPDDAAPRGRNGGAPTPDKVPESGSERMQGAPAVVRAQEDESPAVTSKTRERHGYRPRPTARPQPQPTFWQRLFGRKETKEAKNAKPLTARQ